MGHSMRKPFEPLCYCLGSEAAGVGVQPLLCLRHSEPQRRAGTHLRSQELGTEEGLKSKCSDPRAGPCHCVWLTMGPEVSSWALRGGLLAFRESSREVVDNVASTRTRHQRLPQGVGAEWGWFYTQIFQFASFSTICLF